MQRGHRVTVCVARGDGSYERKLSEGARLVVLSDGWLDSSTWRLVRSIRPLRNYLSSHQPDVVFGAMNHVSICLLRALNGLECSIPTVISVHNNLRKGLIGNSSWTGNFIYWCMRRSYGKADRIVAISKGVASQLLEMKLARPGQISVIYNLCVNNEVHTAQKAPISDYQVPFERPLLVACGRLTEQKGYPYLLDAFRRVRDERQAELWILGEGDQRSTIESRIEELGLVENVSLLGFRNNPFKFMAAADVFVLSSLWEGFGNVIVEAMACGTPVVATDCPHGPGEIITHEKNGLLVPPADSDALSNALLRVLRDQSLKEQLTENGKERARDFHASKIGQQYLGLFREVVSQSKESPQTPVDRSN